MFRVLKRSEYGIGIRFLAIIALSIGLSGCGSEDESPEATLLRDMDAMQEAAEARDLSEFMVYISEQYSDQDGRTWKDIRAMTQLQFVRNPNIHTFKVVRGLEMTNDEHATVTVLAALAGRPIDGASALSGLRAELMRFDLDWVLEEHWRITTAQWSRAESGDFLGN